MKARTLLLCSLLLLSSVAFGADLTGTWQVTITPPTGGQPDRGTATLKQSGSQITGSLGPDEARQMTISEGMIKDNKVTLKVMQGPDRMTTFDLTLTGEKLVGTVERTGRPEKGTVEMVRSVSK